MVPGILDHHPPNAGADQIAIEFAADLLDQGRMKAMVAAGAEPLEAAQADAAGDRHLDCLLFKLFVVQLAVAGMQFSRLVLGAKIVREGNA